MPPAGACITPSSLIMAATMSDLMSGLQCGRNARLPALDERRAGKSTPETNEFPTDNP